MSDLIVSQNEETKPCPKCGKRMVQQFSKFILTTYPPKYSWDWWCGCGYTENGGVVRAQRPETAREKWERVNGGAS